MRGRFGILVATVALLAFLAVPAGAGRVLSKSKGQKVYVPVYSHVYQGIKGKPYNLSALLSLRNVDETRSLIVVSVKYYGDHGQLIKEYLDKPVTVPPLGTTEVHVAERDTEGGSGANFVVQWKAGESIPNPIIQAVMIGTASTQGISFVCDGVVVEEE